MLSLTQFRTHVFTLFILMRDTGATFEVVYKNKVYDVSVRKTDKVARLTRSKRATAVITQNAIETDECPDCGGIRINSVCMNTACASAPLRGVKPNNEHDPQQNK